MTDPGTPNQDQRQPLVMVVEDDNSIRELITRWLNDDGYPCITAENGEQALEQFEDATPDLVLTDIRMPKMDGIALLKQLSQDHPETAVIILTAFDDLNYAEQARKLGAYGFILKPLNRVEVLFNVKKVLGLHKLLALDKSQPKNLPEADLINSPSENSAAEPRPDQWIVNQQKWVLTAPNQVVVPLTNLELKLLITLAQKSGESVSRAALMEQLYPRLDEYTSKALNALVKRLRLKISQDCGLPAPIQTAHSFGYSFSESILIVS